MLSMNSLYILPVVNHLGVNQTNIRRVSTLTWDGLYYSVFPLCTALLIASEGENFYFSFQSESGCQRRTKSGQ